MTMGRLLFEMSDAELDRIAESHYDRMYRDYYHLDEPEPCCKLCSHYDGTNCEKLLDAMTEEEYDAMEESNDWSEVERDDDDYCDDFEMKEADYPDWMDGDDR